MAFTDFLPLISNIAGGMINSGANLAAVREQNKAQMDLAQYQADQNLKLWNLNNAYNTPQAQMQRYRDAGLNPHLIYGNGSASSGNSSAPAQGYQAPTLNRAHIDTGIQNAGGAYLNGLSVSSAIRKQNADTAMVHQQIANLQEDNNLKRLEAISKMYHNSRQETESKFWKQQLEAELANVNSRTVLNRSQTELFNANRENVLLDTEINRALQPLRIKELEANVNNILARTIGQRLENSLNPLRQQALINQIANLAADTENKYSQNALLGEQLSTQREITFDTRYRNRLNKILIDYGLNLSNDELDRLEWQLRQDTGLSTFKKVKFGARVAGAALGK